MKKKFIPDSYFETQRIIVKARPSYLRSDQVDRIYRDSKENIFNYEIEIINRNSEWVQLLYRHWIIIDSDGNTQEVHGEGVVGKQPKLYCGDTFIYSSYCPINSEWGTMEGFFTMLRSDGHTFKARVERFYLIADHLLEPEKVGEFK